MTVAEIREAVIELGAGDTRTVKLLTRGRHGLVPGPDLRLTRSPAWSPAAPAGTDPTLTQLAPRAPVADPVPLGVVAAADAARTRPRLARSRMTHAPTRRHPRWTRKPWHGVLVATALPWRRRLSSADLDAYAEHVAGWPTTAATASTPNGSLGEYQTLTTPSAPRSCGPRSRPRPSGFSVMPGVAAYGAAEAPALGRAGGRGRRARR